MGAHLSALLKVYGVLIRDLIITLVVIAALYFIGSLFLGSSPRSRAANSLNTLPIKSGLNYVSLPSVPPSINTASRLMSVMAMQQITIIRVMDLEEGKEYGQNAISNDFLIEPDHTYILDSSSEGTFILQD